MGKSSDSPLVVMGPCNPPITAGVLFHLRGGESHTNPVGRHQDAVVQVAGKDVFPFMAVPSLQEMPIEDLSDVLEGALGRNSHIHELIPELEDHTQVQILKEAVSNSSRFGFIQDGSFNETAKTLTFVLTEKEAVASQ